MSSSQTVERYQSDLFNLLGKRPREDEDLVNIQTPLPAVKPKSGYLNTRLGSASP